MLLEATFRSSFCSVHQPGTFQRTHGIPAAPRSWATARRSMRPEVRRQLSVARASNDDSLDMEGLSVADKNADSANRTDADWLGLLPSATSALYCCSLQGIEAWLRSLGFQQRPNRPEEWRLAKDTWNAELTMDVTEFCVRYTSSDKQGTPSPGKLTVERKFSYALSRQDLENAILAGP